MIEQCAAVVDSTPWSVSILVVAIAAFILVVTAVVAKVWLWDAK